EYPGKYTTEKGSDGEVPEGTTTDVVVIDDAKDEENNKDFVGELSLLEGGKSCVDGLQVLEIGGCE
ncbi:hypothetical protein A4A49_54255, partial [Nicotiana attenuata]